MTAHPDVAATRELSEAKWSYCRMLDGKCWDRLAALMSDDIEFGIQGEDGGTSMTIGRKSTLASLQSMVEGSQTTHQVDNPRFDLNDDVAHVDWSMTCTALFGDGTSVTGRGHYIERWHREDGTWKLALMVLSEFHTST